MTAYERGWSKLKNGELLDEAEKEGFEVLVTTDLNLRYQQNLQSRRISPAQVHAPGVPAARGLASHARALTSGRAAGCVLPVSKGGS